MNVLWLRTCIEELGVSPRIPMDIQGADIHDRCVRIHIVTHYQTATPVCCGEPACSIPFLSCRNLGRLAGWIQQEYTLSNVPQLDIRLDCRFEEGYTFIEEGLSETSNIEIQYRYPRDCEERKVKVNLKRYNVPESNALMQEQDYIYIDVRTPEEFEAGHPEGAFNIPVNLRDPELGRMIPNEEFVSIVEAHFAKDAKLLLGCRSGVRSTRAAMMLDAVGYTDLAENYPGWMGARDGSPGWSLCDVPQATGQPDGRSYSALVQTKS